MALESGGTLMIETVPGGGLIFFGVGVGVKN
jgi:hypothetical protein